MGIDNHSKRKKKWTYKRDKRDKDWRREEKEKIKSSLTCQENEKDPFVWDSSLDSKERYSSFSLRKWDESSFFRRNDQLVSLQIFQEMFLSSSSVNFFFPTFGSSALFFSDAVKMFPDEE